MILGLHNSSDSLKPSYLRFYSMCKESAIFDYQGKDMDYFRVIAAKFILMTSFFVISATLFLQRSGQRYDRLRRTS